VVRVAILALFAAACAPPPQAETRAPLMIAAPAAPHQWARANPAWVEPVAPFRVIGPIHYVGSADLASFLIRTDDGFILLDGGLPDNAPMIADSIAKLGFDLRDVKILLNSHAHFDHSGGLAALKAASGATLIASEGDRSALEGGFYLGSESNASFAAPPVKVDRVVADGESVTLGGVTMTARLTPGHSPGCTSWTMRVREGAEAYDVLFFCSATVAANRLVGPPQYEGIVEDYRGTFEKMRDWRPDVFLAAHASFFDMEAKRQKLLAGDPLAFVDRESFPKLRERQQADLERQLAAQTAQAAQK
jgi:metallo-beta-lactamase class B